MAKRELALAPAVEPLQHEELDLEEHYKLESNYLCDCYHDYHESSVDHYLSLPTVNVLAGDSPPLQEESQAEGCFKRATWVAIIQGESPDGYVPPSSRLVCDWCKDYWQRNKSHPANSFEMLR